MKRNFRKLILAGNWKMNKTVSETAQFLDSFQPQVSKEMEASLLIFPPFTSLFLAADRLSETSIRVGAQNMHWEKLGAFTGEISPDMLRDLYITHVLLGHSERRQIFGESLEMIHKKMQAALENRLVPVLCVGETLEERKMGKTLDVLRTQLLSAVEGIQLDAGSIMILAYEPVWAIGTGESATAEMAQETHHQLRQELAKRFGEKIAKRISILYGGSVKPSNAQDLFKQEDIDGGLIGGASLTSNDFLALAEIVQEINAS